MENAIGVGSHAPIGEGYRIDRPDVSPSLLRNGWLVGGITAIAIMAGFFIIYRDVRDPLIVLTMIWAPIGAAIGALVGIGIDPRSLPPRRRLGLGLSVIAGFVLYSIGLLLYLLSRV